MKIHEVAHKMRLIKKVEKPKKPKRAARSVTRSRIDARAAARAIVGMIESFAYGVFVGGEPGARDRNETTIRYMSDEELRQSMRDMSDVGRSTLIEELRKKLSDGVTFGENELRR